VVAEIHRATYPPAPHSDDADDLHGIRIPDPFRALEDPDTPATKTWMSAQRDLLDEHRRTWPARPSFHKRLDSLLRSGSVGAPIWRGSRAFFTRRDPEQQHPVLLKTEGEGLESVLVDPMAVDPSGATTLDAWQPSKEGDLLAYQLSEGGTEESRLRIIDVATGELVDGPIERVRYTPVAWLPGGGAFYYVKRLAPHLVPADERQYHRRVYLHRLGTSADADTEIFGEGMDKTAFFGVSVSRDGRWLTVTAGLGTAPRNDSWIADLKGVDLERPALVPILVGADAQVDPYVGRDGRLYVQTDLNAPRGRLAVTNPQQPDPTSWRDLIPEDPDAVLADFAILDAMDRPQLLVSRTRHAISELSVHDLDSGQELARPALPGLGSIGGITEHPEGGHEAWFGYTDYTTAPMVLRFDADAGDLSTWATSPGIVDVPDVHTEQVTYRSKDGTEVRMVIVSPINSDDLTIHQTRPTVLYGYGGFNISLTPAYSATILAWVEAGGVWAVANLRGGSEEGEAWHRAGRRESKQNVFDDFHAAAEYLIDNGYTTSDQLGISGGSNGGLLVGAALTQRPDLFAAVHCSAPLLDMVRYEHSGLGQLWSDEYGTAAVPEELEWLRAYSPYHNVRNDVAYPATLFTIFDSDTRVDPMHARKMTATMQHATTGGPVLLRAETDVGHGARSVSRSVDLAADQLAFLAWQLGMAGGAVRTGVTT
jgi:prolyl oligopeptidase